MRLSELFTEKTNRESTAQTVSAQHNTADVNRQIRALVPGQTIHGEIVGRSGSEVRIKLSEDMVLNARLDSNISLEMGKALTFEVKNNGAALTLSPLFTNVATDVNVLKALDMAGLPVNETSVEMTKQLMEAGLPVNKAALQQAYREIHAFGGRISDVVSLHQLQLPVNEENMSQMAAYRNLTYQLTDAMDTILELLPQAAEQLLSEGKVQEASALYQELLNAAQEAALLSPEGTPGAQDGGTAGGILQPDGQAGGAEGAVWADGLAKEAADALLAAWQDGGSAPAPQAAEAGGAAAGRAAAGTETEALPVSDTARQALSDAFLGALEKQELTPETRQAFAAQLEAFAQGDGSAAELFALSGRLLLAAGRSESAQAALQECFGREDFRQLLSEQLKNLWTIRPEEVSSPEKVTELYRRLDRQLNGLTRALEAGGQTESAAYRTVSAMSQNLDFLQQLNQMYAYVQLPLHLQQGRAHGDLYVYANRKGLAARGGQVSALLHLDMEHLGPVDVHVALQEAKVSTKFYVRDDGTLDFLEEHMELLTERLNRRGYSCDCSMAVRNRGEELQDKGLQPILEQDRGALLSHYAFDVRT